jgi:hypothetical protein
VWIYIGLDVFADVYVYVKDWRYVYVKPRVRGWRAPTIYIGKIEDVLAGLVKKVKFSAQTLKKLHEVYIKYLQRRTVKQEYERRMEEKLRREIESLKRGEEEKTEPRSRQLERARELVEFLRDVLAAVHKYLTSLDNIVSRLMNLIYYTSDRVKIEKKLYEAKDKFFREILSRWELEREARTVLDVIEEAIQDAEQVLSML